MAEKKTAKKTAGAKASKGLTPEEKAALRDLAKERKAEQEGKNAEDAVLARIASMPEPDRSLAKKVHAIVKQNAPGLRAKTWYGMPAYADAAGKVVCFFQDAAKFKSRYATLGFSDEAKLDDGAMWPTSWALTKVSAADESKIAALVKKAAR